jgi:long-chain acyl-CoA synthetase
MSQGAGRERGEVVRRAAVRCGAAVPGTGFRRSQGRWVILMIASMSTAPSLAPEAPLPAFDPDTGRPLLMADSPVAVSDLVRQHAQRRPAAPALVQGGTVLSWAALDRLMVRIAASLARDGLRVGDAVALCGTTTPLQAALFLGALRAGAVVVPLASSSDAAGFAAMLADAGARWLFADASAAALVPASPQARVIALDGETPGQALQDWLVEDAGRHAQVPVPYDADAPFNIIYSSGTTGTPKGIVQPCGMRWMHMLRGVSQGYGPDTVTLLATPLYSNTTLVCFFPSIAFGGTVVLMPKFDAAQYLQLAQQHRATHTMLVPVQYQRIMARPDFGQHDLSAFRLKLCTSAPFSAALKADILARWPGGLTEVYGMTEGGGSCMLEAHLHPDKLHTVGRPATGSDVRLIDDHGVEVAPGASGEVVGHSRAMMQGYHHQDQKTREAEWTAPDGRRFIRTGDIGRFDADGFLVLMDRKKDMIISGGFNIYPSDLEAKLREHPAVADAAVVGVPSEQWGETPVAFVVRHAGDATLAEPLREWLNTRVGKVQRVAAVTLVEELPRSAIGKVLKRALRDQYLASAR